MHVNRSGYYKWRKRQGILNRYERDRKLLTDLLEEAHEKHRLYGYHRLATGVRQETGWLFSDNLAHKHCKYAGIKSRTNYYNWKRPLKGEEYNIIRSMSRAGTPTDNPVIEAINGWIKAEIYSEGWHRKYDSADEMIRNFVEYYNNVRPAFALQYKSPIQYTKLNWASSGF